MNRPAAVKAITVVTGVFFLAFGLWAFFAPQSFYDQVATFEPYNVHFLHDAGAFQLGAAAVLLFALKWRDALFVALAGSAVGAVFHVISHAMDRPVGGGARDLVTLGLMAALLILGAAWTYRGAGSRS